MKTKMLSLILTAIVAFQSPLYAGFGEKGELRRGILDTSRTSETTFEMTFDEENNKLVVQVSGEFDPYSSVSITNNRGSEFYFKFVENGTNQYAFDLTELDSGAYYLVLNMNNEIRIKRFQKK